MTGGYLVEIGDPVQFFSANKKAKKKEVFSFLLFSIFLCFFFCFVV